MRVIRAAMVLLTLAFAATAVAHPLMTKSQAKAIVRDVNLKASDMAKYDAFRSNSDQDRASLARIARCSGGVPPSRGLATGSSPVFLHTKTAGDYEIFGSVVTVFPKPALAQKDLRALRSARGRECLRSALSSGGQVTVTATTLQSAVSGVFGYRFKQTLPEPDSRSPAYVDYIFMGVRSGEATVVISSHPAAPAQSLEDKVIRIVKTRLQARLDPNTVL